MSSYIPNKPAAIQSVDFKDECSHHGGHLDGDNHTGDGIGHGDSGVVSQDDKHEVDDEVSGIIHEVDQVIRYQRECQ